MGHGGREAVNRRCCHLKSFAVVGELPPYDLSGRLDTLPCTFSLHTLSFVFLCLRRGAQLGFFGFYS